MLIITSAHAAVPGWEAPGTPSVAAAEPPKDHEPIRIYGNGDLTASNGVVAGSGHPHDPYVISGWRIDGNGTDGIRIVGTTAHLIVRNVHVFNATDGVDLRNVKHVTVATSTLEGNLRGIHARDTVHLTLDRVDATGNLGDGVHLEDARDTRIEGIRASDNGDDGLSGRTLRRADIVGSHLLDNGDAGLTVDDAAALNVTRNRIVGNDAVGIDLHRVRGSILYDNVLDNPVNAEDRRGSNAWNVSKRPGPNVLGGPYLGGNAWSDYPGADTDGDGLGDTHVPHPVGRSGDHLPLVRWNGSDDDGDGSDPSGNGTDGGSGGGEGDGSGGNDTDDGGGDGSSGDGSTGSNEPPEANFTIDPHEPNFGELVWFNDTSIDADGNLTAWSWDLGDGNTSTQQHPEHRYEREGNYTVTLTVTDDDGATASHGRNLTVGTADGSNDTGSCEFTYRFLHGDGTPVNLTGRNVSFTITDRTTGVTLDTQNGSHRVSLTAGGYVKGSFPEDACAPGDHLAGELRVNESVEHVEDEVPASGVVDEEKLMELPLAVDVSLMTQGPWEDVHAYPHTAVPVRITLRWTDGTPVDGANVSIESTWPQRAASPPLTSQDHGTTEAGVLWTLVPFDVAVDGSGAGTYLPGRHHVKVDAWLITPEVLYQGDAEERLNVIVDA